MTIQRILESIENSKRKKQSAKQAKAEKAKQQAEETARKAAEELKAKLAQLVAQAQSLLNGGNFQGAIDIAQQVLNQDVGNATAKTIIETAKRKIAELAQHQAEALKQEAAAAVEGLGNLVDPSQQ